MILAVICLTIGLISAPALNADEQPLYRDIQSDDHKIHIKSDALVASNDENLAEFTGRVRATRGTMVITCERLKLFFKQGAMAENGSNPGSSSIERIEAKKNVKIKMDDRLAFADQAEYTLSNGDIILTGDPVKVSSGNTFITGNKITMGSDGRIHVQPTPGKQVEAILYPKTETPNPKKNVEN